MPDSPATRSEITVALGALFRGLRPPIGIKAEHLMEVYFAALDGMPLHAVESAAARYLRGEVPKQSDDFAPRPPALARVARTFAPDVVIKAEEEPKRKYFGYRQPSSKILERHITKAWAMQLLANGVHPRGCIWCPGPINDSPEYGDLYGPDPGWKKPVPLEELAKPRTVDHYARIEAPSFEAKERIEALLASVDIGKRGRRLKPGQDARAAPPERKIHDYSKDKVEISPVLAKQLEETARMKGLQAEMQGTEFDSSPPKQRKDRK